MERYKNSRSPELELCENSGTVNIDGIMYWLTEHMVASWQHAVMTFDLNEERVSRIELPAVVPEDCAGGGPRRYWIREINGKISIATAQTYTSMPRRLVGKLQIWTLDSKAEHRWSQMYNIEYPPDYIPGPNLVHGDKIVLPRFGGNLYYYELLGENFNTKLGKMAKLFDFSPHKPGNMQSYIFVKSLVRLDVYKKAGIVCRPKQREGWELKKWETWEQQLSKDEKSWSNIYRREHDGTACAQSIGVMLNGLLPHVSDDVIRSQISMKIKQTFPNFPAQQPRPLRRLNLVEQKRDMKNLLSRMKNYNTVMEGIKEETDSICSMIHSTIQNKFGDSSSNAGSSSQKQREGDDTKT